MALIRIFFDEIDMITTNIRQWQNHQGQHLDSKNGFDVIACETCNFKHIVPIPTIEELENIYKHEYYTQEKPLYLDRYKEDLAWWTQVYQDRYDYFEQFLTINQRRILDVGSGPGYFLLQGKDRGWNTLGIEPSQKAAAHSRELGLDIIETFLTEESAKELGTFDVINMGEVLEHISHPEKLLAIAHDLLAPGGLLCVIVPNDYNPFQMALKTACDYEPWWVAPPHHINYFDFDSLSGLIIRCGFDELLRRSTFPIDMFLLMGDNYVGNDEIGRLCHTKRMRFEDNLAKAGLNDFKGELYKSLGSLGVGREVLMIGKKRSGP